MYQRVYTHDNELRQHAKHPLKISVEVLAHLVVASVFKTVGSYVNRAIGGFDSHALPPFFLGTACRLSRPAVTALRRIGQTDLRRCSLPKTLSHRPRWNRWHIVLVCFISVGLGGCNRRSADEHHEVRNDVGKFSVFWPPRDLDRASTKPDKPLLNGELSVFRTETNPANAFRMHITLQRPNSETDRVRWNKNLAFPQHSWMAEVRVWDLDHQWLWPNLSYLLRAHGEERVERYGGVDPGKGVDNDFAAVLIRALEERPSGTDEREPAYSTPPLVSAEWYFDGVENADKYSVVHVARSDDFTMHFSPTDRQLRSGRLGVWLIYADFLGAGVPRNWPAKGEYEGGVLAYFEVSWQQDSSGEFEFDIKHLVPPTDTGFDWADWSTGQTALKKNLELRYR